MVISTYISYTTLNVGWALVDANNDTIIEQSGWSSGFTTFYSDQFCITSCEDYNFEMVVGSWYDGWQYGDNYNILTPTGVDSIPWDTLQSGALESGNYGVDVFSHCIGLDATLEDIPLSSTCTDFDQHVTIQVKNSGTDTIFTLDVNYAIDSGTVITETINDTIIPGDLYNFTFNTIEDFSTEGEYQVTAWISSSNDLNSSNNSMSTVYDLYGDFIIDAELNSGGYASEVSWNIVDSNNDTIFNSPSYGSSYSTYNSSLCVKECEIYTVNLYDSYGDGWNGADLTISSTEVDTSLSDTLLFNNTFTTGYSLIDNFFYCESPDIAVTQVNVQSGCIYTDEHEVIVNLENLSSLDTVQDFLLSYNLNGDTTYTDSVTLEILSGAEISYTLENTFDLSAIGNHNLVI